MRRPKWSHVVIAPRQTRPKLIKALRVLQTKRVEQPKRKHGNIPL